MCVSLQLAAEPPRLAEYQTYIDFEQKEGDPARIQITFERTLAENCLVPDMWAKYTTYLVSAARCEWVLLGNGLVPRMNPRPLRGRTSLLLLVTRDGASLPLQDRQLKIKELVLSAHERAVRNCPWTMGLWKSYLLALERHGADHHTVSGTTGPHQPLTSGVFRTSDLQEGLWPHFA